MNFEWNDEERQLRDSLRRLLGDGYSFEARRGIVAGEAGWSQRVWSQLAELGVTGLPLAERHGGFGAGAASLFPVLEEFGRVLLVEPYLASIVLGATAVAEGADPALAAELLPGVAGGDTLLAFAHDEVAARHALPWTQTRARADGERWLLNGEKINVLHGASAHRLIVSARTWGEPGDASGLALFLVEPDADGLRMEACRLIDDTPAANIGFHSTPARMLGDAAQGWAAIEAAQHAGMAAVCAEAVGVMQAAYDLTVGYVNTRQQFGRPIGGNQAVGHRIAEMKVSLETARSAALAGLLALDERGSPAARADLARAKMLIGRHGRFVTQQAVQLHGGIGMTEDYAVGHYLRRFIVIDTLFGDADAHAARLGELLAA